VTSPQTTESAETATGIVLSDAAAVKAKALLDQEGRDDLRLRVAVQPGGCSGLRYQLFFDERELEGDQVRQFGGVPVVVDRMSAPYLAGATIDFVDRIDAQGFTIDNPNAQPRVPAPVATRSTDLLTRHPFARSGTPARAIVFMCRPQVRFAGSPSATADRLGPST
jgi:iron-sulfur cluster assembly accessory protein